MAKDYVTVSLPRKLIRKIETIIDSGETGYTSKADFIKDAIRIRLRELGENV